MCKHNHFMFYADAIFPLFKWFINQFHHNKNNNDNIIEIVMYVVQKKIDWF